MQFDKKGAIANFITWYIFFMPFVNLCYGKIKNSSVKGEKNAENNNRSKRNKMAKR